MSLSLYERFLGYDWVRFSGIASKGTCLGAAVIGLVSVLVLGSIWTGILSIFIALVMAVWEFPWIYYCIPKSDMALKLLDEKVYLQREEVKATICIILSILTYISLSFATLTGLLLDVTALLFIFAAINKIQDRRDGMVPTDEEQARPYEQRKQPPAIFSSSATQSLLQASGRFGTF
jgi:hypothetical protein